MDKAMELARKAIESQYKGLCTIIEYKDTEDPDTGETINKPVPVYEDIPCKLSKKNLSPAGDGEMANTISYAPVLFLAPETEIKAGSKILVTQNGATREYKRSGEPFLYETHQEIVLQRTDTA